MGKLKLSIIIVLALLIFCRMDASAKSVGYGLINVEELKRDPDAGMEMTVVDARNPEEFQEVHIKGAISVPVKQWDKYAFRLPIRYDFKKTFYLSNNTHVSRRMDRSLGVYEVIIG